MDLGFAECGIQPVAWWHNVVGGERLLKMGFRQENGGFLAKTLIRGVSKWGSWPVWGAKMVQLLGKRFSLGLIRPETRYNRPRRVVYSGFRALAPR